MTTRDAHTLVSMVGKATWPQWDYGIKDFKEHAIMLKLSLNELLQTTNNGNRPPKEEVTKAIDAIVAFVDRVIEEPKIQIVLDEVRKLAIDTNNRETSIEEKVTYIKYQILSNISGSIRSSYSSILS